MIKPYSKSHVFRNIMATTCMYVHIYLWTHKTNFNLLVIMMGHIIKPFEKVIVCILSIYIHLCGFMIFFIYTENGTRHLCFLRKQLKVNCICVWTLSCKVPKRCSIWIKPIYTFLSVFLSFFPDKKENPWYSRHVIHS